MKRSITRKVMSAEERRKLIEKPIQLNIFSPHVSKAGTGITDDDQRVRYYTPNTLAYKMHFTHYFGD